MMIRSLEFFGCQPALICQMCWVIRIKDMLQQRHSHTQANKNNRIEIDIDAWLQRMCRWKQRPRMRCGGGGDNEPTALHIYYQMALSFNSHLCLSRVCFSLEIRLWPFFSSVISSCSHLLHFFSSLELVSFLDYLVVFLHALAFSFHSFTVYTSEWDKMVRQFIAFIWRISEDAMWLHHIRISYSSFRTGSHSNGASCISISSECLFLSLD